MKALKTFLHNRRIIKSQIGVASYMIAFRHVSKTKDSISGEGSMMVNDAPRLLYDESTNAAMYLNMLLATAQNVSKIIGKDHEDWNDVANKFTQWCSENKSNSGIGCPHKFYFVNYSTFNETWTRRMIERISMMFHRYPFVIHLVRDRTLDRNGGGYFFQIHCYSCKRDNFGSNGLEDKFVSTMYDCLKKIKFNKTRCTILTNPSVFARFRDWAFRCYIGYNNIVYGLFSDINCALNNIVFQVK